MFDLPYGIPIEDEIDVSDGTIMPFENGAITTYLSLIHISEPTRPY